MLSAPESVGFGLPAAGAGQPQNVQAAQPTLALGTPNHQLQDPAQTGNAGAGGLAGKGGGKAGGKGLRKGGDSDKPKVPNPITKANAKLKDGASKLLESKTWSKLVQNAPEQEM